MSESDAEFVAGVMERWIELVSRRDLPGLEAWLAEFFDEGAQVSLGPGAPSGDVRLFLEWAQAAFAMWSAEGLQPHYEVVELVDHGDSIAVRSRSLAEIDGRPFETAFTYVFRVHDGKVTSMSLRG